MRLPVICWAVACTLLISCSGSESGTSGNDTHSGKDSTGLLDLWDQQGEDVPGDGQSEVTPCTGTCTEEGQKQCFQGGVRQCEDLDDDGCFDWSDVTQCPPGTTCDDGQCVVSCAEQPCTVLGTRKCGDNNVILECRDFDEDGCLEWGNPQPCDTGLVCSNGFCATSCSDACTVMGAVKCEGNSVVTCDDHNQNGCLDWGNASPCGTLVCSNGHCQEQCVNECTQAGARICDGTKGYKVCGDTDSDPCLEWGSTVNCGEDFVCSNGNCVAQCSNECTAIGAKKCLSGGVSTCNDYNFDGCLEWGNPLNCAPGLVCSNGQCVSECTSECTVSGTTTCDEGGNVVTCNDYNSDGCLEWGTPVQCESPLVCSQGSCVLDCTSDCPAVGVKECVVGTTNQYRMCGDWNQDGCLRWGSPVTCEGSYVCSSGNCAVSCQNTCIVVNETACNPAGTAVIICGDYNSDGCLEWGTPTYCQVYQSCQGGACVQQPAPAKVLINEVLYNSEGPDIDVFVEMKGPAGQSLAGYSLVGVNGNGTGDYNAISLGGVIPATGFFVVSHPEAMPSIADVAQQFSDKVDFENGPDSIQLRYGTVVVDAVGYGTFGDGAAFAGEGAPAPGVSAGSSLGRDAASEDTNNNAMDFYEYTSPTPGAANVMSNLAPQAVLQCPTSGSVGQSLVFDGAASTDADGTVVVFAFTFGDGSPQVSGSQATVEHSYSAAGSYTVTLTVEDNHGATDVANCSLSVGDENVPEVTIIKPMNNKQVTQGDVVQVLVNATAAPGRNITQVQLLAAGVPFGAADTQAPYEFFYTVPESQPTNSVLSLQAKATDSAGSQGYSPIAALQVKNDPPVASFTAVVSGALQVSVDAGGCFDTETPVELLEVRWDFQNDGVWDTDWSTTKLAQHTYPSDGTYTIKMAVRDEAEQVSQTTRQITLSSIQYVAGEVTTTTWTGTIVITGDVTVPSGHTLTISPDTSVLFAWNDQNQDGVGDWGILVQGTLLVQGTQAKPVIFTSLGTAHKHSKAWDRIDLRGSGHSIAYAIIEYAEVGLSLAGGGAVSDSTVRFSKTGVLVNSGGAFTFDRCTISSNDTNGLEMSAGAATVNFSSLLSNGHAGAYVRAGTFNLYDSEVNGNGTVGVRFYTSGTGEIRRNLITGSAYEGVRIETNGSTDPNPTIQYNNIVGNALVGARIQQTVSMTASVTGQYTTNSAGPWSTPAGEAIDFLRYSYSEGDSSSNYYTGSILDGATTLVTKSSSDSGWLNLLGQGVSSASARVQSYSSSSSYYGTMDVTAAVYDQAGAVRELSAITRTQRVDARHNYFGVFPDVLEVITVGPQDRVNVEGFVGQPFDDTWSKGNYYGGETINTDLTWFGDVIITGQLDVTTGATLTVAAGVTVKFGCVDANGNGVGDCDIDVQNSTLISNGTQDQPVVFTDYRALKTAGSWYRLRCAGPGGLQATHTIIEYAETGLYLEAGTHVLDRVTTRQNALHGAHLKNATSVTATGLVSRDNGGNGMHIESSSGVSLNKAPGQVLQLRDNAGHGLYASASTNSLSLSNCSVSGNDGAGLFFTGSHVTVDHCTVQQNQYGAWYEGSSFGSMTACDVKFNDREGIFLSTRSTNPNPTITGSNLYGNSVVEAGILVDPSLSATVSGQYTTKTEGPWTTPNGSGIQFMQVQYTEGDSSSNYYTGSVLPSTAATSTLYSASSSSGLKFVDLRDYDTSSVAARVTSYSSSSSYYGTMAVPAVFYYADSTAGLVKELAALTDSGTVTCTGNYWGLGLDQLAEIPNRLTLGRQQAVNYSGYVGTENSGTGPQ